MGLPPFSPDEGTLVLVFGSQALDFNEESAEQLRSALLGKTNLEWISETILELSTYWGVISGALPVLKTFAGFEHLEGLNEWLRTGKFPNGSFPLPNILLTPLVVITHLAQYSAFLEHFQADLGLRDNLQSSLKYRTETLGLCTGLLSAAAISSSANQAQIQKYGAAAIRMAMAIGALVDAKDTVSGSQSKWKSFSIGWSPANDEEVVRILKDFPEAYFSVAVEERRATMSALRSSSSKLVRQLKDAGLTVAELAIRGSFHCEGNGEEAEALVHFFNSNPAFQFPNASEVVLPTRSNTGGDYINGGKMHHVVAQSMLVEQSNWHQAFSALQSSTLTPESLVISFGRERCVPPALIRKLGQRFVQITELDLESVQLPARFIHAGRQMNAKRELISDEAIAVVGMSCQVPGSTDLEGFWDSLVSGKSQHKEVPSDRISFETAWRDLDPKRKWYGNFIEDYDTFDHKFFKKSPREMSSTDPQHRLMLQASYQAVEQSGYFNMKDQDQHIGTYIGVGLVDYENNIASHAATAYAATGNLKSFAAGKISHYFGWTGPGLTIDTACSSSAVAVHQACRAIITGECSAALAGGVNIMTSPEWFQNLAGASFLSSTGQCKPFDTNADGYCRGEAVGAVFLKKLSAAIEDGNQVLGVIASTGVYQNQNCTAITVPNAVSLSDLFRNVTRRAGLDLEQISVVEAHGTGTQVGDPAEYDSVRQVFGGSGRLNTLSLGSVKGLVGHTESASGIVALIKTLLMINKGAIPPQASFQTINPAIHALPTDNIDITTKLQPWETEFRAALINNYGASGSNASLVVTQAPAKLNELTQASSRALASKYPFWLCGFDDQSLKTYATKLLHFLKSTSTPKEKLSLANLSFQVSRQSNRLLSHALIFGCSTIQELEVKLAAVASGQKDVSATRRVQSPRPVILCFGGQISTFVGLDKDVFENFTIMRNSLDQCNEFCLSLGLDSIYPEIFQKTPVLDIVKLQTMLFSIQYSCAKAWIDSGVKIAAVVGHSFGELTAMCVSGTLSAKDTLKMIAGRARVIRDSWGEEKGSMMAVEADEEDVTKLLAEASESAPEETAATIACFNGPRSFTLAGSAKAIDGVKQTATGKAFSSIKTKKLDVTNSFHSTLVEPLMVELETVGQALVFREPTIPHERATKDGTPTRLDASFVATHMRSPVYFNHAVQRLLQRNPSCIFLEAGSNSTITNMASRALGSPKNCHFQPINITTNGAFQFLTDATINLWKEGLSVSFWAHHPVQIASYAPILLPPYQFEKAKHWMELKKPLKQLAVEAPVQPQILEAPRGLWTFVGYQDAGKRSVRFRVNTMVEKYQDYVSAHVIAQTAPICASTFQLVIAIDALQSLVGDSKNFDLLPELRGMDSHAPLCMDASKFVWLDATLDENNIWGWKMISTTGNGPASTLHVSGKIAFKPAGDITHQNDFARYERLVGRKRCLDLLDGNQADGVIQGSRNIYKAFSEIVQYDHPRYKGLQKLVGKDDESAGRISMASKGEAWLDLGLADSFCQVAGIFLNSMTDHSDADMFISDRIDQWIRNPKMSTDSNPQSWEVFACHHRPSDKEYTSDVFAFDSLTGQLVEVILGIHYVRVQKAGMAKLLSRLSPGSKVSAAPPSVSAEIPVMTGVQHAPISKAAETLQAPASKKEMKSKKESSRPDITGSVRGLLCNLSGLEPEEIKTGSDLVDLGIDSLMGMELAREVENMFKITLEMSDLLDLTDFQSLINCIQAALGFGVEAEEDESDDKPEPVVQEMLHVNGFTPIVNGNGAHANGVLPPQVNGVHTNGDVLSSLPASAILETFAETKQATDRFLTENKFSNYSNSVLPKTTEMCVVHILDAFDQLGFPLRNAKPGQVIKRIEYLPRHEQCVDFLYDTLEKARLVDLDGPKITRTAITAPTKSAETLLKDLLRDGADHAYDHRLTYLTGCKLADCLTGRADGLQLIFASPEGREIVSGMYGKSPINVAWIKQIEYFLTQFFMNLPKQEAPIRILEMGAGTGGTTARLVPLLASLGVPFEYTVTDLSASLVAGARKRFKEYPFMKFKVVDIEGEPPEELLHSQHLVIATNCVHATHSLVKSTQNIHTLLRPDGFLMMLEMTETLPWIDLVFGLLEGWWLFDDGRRHALAPPEVWESTMKSVGYGHVDWTEGNLPEAGIQRIIIALASGPEHERVPKLPKPVPNYTADLVPRQVVIDTFIEQYSRGFAVPEVSDILDESSAVDHCVLVTGATGSLGSHLVAYFASQPNVQKVICLNRHNSTECTTRQRQALESKGIFLPSAALSKLKVLETDTFKPKLGLSDMSYTKLVNSVTHIVHNAWPMSTTRPINAFEGQFKAMRNLIDLANESSARIHPKGPKVGFQFISSIATVGYHPIHTGVALVPEEKMLVDSVLPTGYSEAKLVCEKLLDETLHKYPDTFRPMAVRIGQISGSKVSGHWNPVEHFAFLIKSSQTLKMIPDFEGNLSWCPANDVAATLGEILLGSFAPYPIYHIENPARQSWPDMVRVLAEALDIPQTGIIPFDKWIDRVRQFPPSNADVDNPAARLADFLEAHFLRMSCGGLILDTAHSKEHSETLRNSVPVSRDLVRKYVQTWKDMGFLR